MSLITTPPHPGVRLKLIWLLDPETVRSAIRQELDRGSGVLCGAASGGN